MAARGTRATRMLASMAVAHTVHAYAHDGRAWSSYGSEAAAALGLPAGQVFKTLIVSVDGELVVAVVPVAGQLDLKALAAAAGGKRAELASPTTAQRVTGYVIGGISPIAQRRRLRAVVDAAVLDHPTVFCSAGQRGLEVELAPADLIRVTDATVARIARQ